MHRINVIGTSAAGKSTFCKRLAGALNLPHIELDALNFEPGWIEVSPDIFRNKVAEAIAGGSWVVDGNYSIAREMVWPMADTIIWLDYSFPLVLWRAIRRTFGRVITGEKCCNGNRESLRKALSRESIIWWVIKTHHGRRKRFQKLLPELKTSNTEVVILRSPVAAEKWLSVRTESVRFQNTTR
jgi:adenylate kinase family enzyme